MVLRIGYYHLTLSSWYHFYWISEASRAGSPERRKEAEFLVLVENGEIWTEA